MCAFVPVIFSLRLLHVLGYVRMFYGPSWSDLNKYIGYIHLNKYIFCKALLCGLPAVQAVC